MEVLDQVISKLQTVRDSLPDIAVKVLNDSASQIEDKIIFQLRQGLTGDGTYLRNYSQRSVEEFGKPFGPIKLFETGDYYQALKAMAFGSVLEIDDTDWKDPKLTEEFGPKIKALTDQSLQELQEETFLPGMLHEVNQLLVA
jgi:hypothetical protein